VLDAGTQGMIGYLIQQELRNLAAGGAVPAALAELLARRPVHRSAAPSASPSSFSC
jgi:carbamate kinase